MRLKDLISSSEIKGIKGDIEVDIKEADIVRID